MMKFLFVGKMYSVRQLGWSRSDVMDVFSTDSSFSSSSFPSASQFHKRELFFFFFFFLFFFFV
jgi:hypothetical protein